MKIDFHVHSNISNDGNASLEEIAKAAKEKGLDAVCVADHNAMALFEPTIINGVLVINGSELSCKNAHILAVGANKSLWDCGYDPKNLPSIEEAVERIHAAGGLAIIAHPFAHNVAVGFNPKNLSLQPDGVEVFNARAWMKNKNADKDASSYANEYGLFTTGGSDAHCIDEMGNAYTQIPGEGLGWPEIKEALRQGKSLGILSSNTKRIYKAKSQMTRRKKLKKSLWKAYLVYIKCWTLDLLKC